jgi:hypothetical protein
MSWESALAELLALTGSETEAADPTTPFVIGTVHVRLAIDEL